MSATPFVVPPDLPESGEGLESSRVDQNAPVRADPGRDRRRRPIDEKLTRQSAAAAAAVVCVSQATAEDAARILGIDRNRLHVVHPGVRTSLFRPAEIAVGDSRYVLHVGILRGRKNPAGVL